MHTPGDIPALLERWKRPPNRLSIARALRFQDRDMFVLQTRPVLENVEHRLKHRPGVGAPFFLF